ncbi:DEAD/DEAH box helicase family protein [Ferruginibacter yonginensis]|uniref:DEAD/DEAH box helicase family protein n=1 Tax=Ferruginibacter yonginensis TaxID=1310416 RepID=A0ABV8QTM7_9BACT
MLKNADWSIDRDYKTGSENEPLQFYLDGLATSNEFSLLLGYFSSSAINLLSVGFATFISKGGKMKMVINHLLSSKDKKAIEIANHETINKVFDLTDVVTLGRVLDEYDTHFFECLAYLIAEKRIEIKVIKPKNGRGIAHYKSGVFSDGQDFVGYKASCNFTLYGLSENLEELEAFLSWENGRSNKLIKKQLKLIDAYFTEEDEDVDYIPVNEIEVVLKDRFGKKEINELLVQEEQLLRKKQGLISNPKLKKTITKLFDKIETIRREPRFPFSSGPRAYQMEAYSNWVSNNYQGIFAMATGTGKTITSINCLLQEVNKDDKKNYHALILVPTITLVNQWADEANRFNFKEIIQVSSNNDWESDLATTLSTNKRIPTSFIIIATYASFIKDRFSKYIKDLPQDTLFIADEAHNLGSKSVLSKLSNVLIQKRIGLSATPKRIYDIEGSSAMENFFNDSEPYTYSFSMERAIEEGILCKYYYHPHLVTLTSDELKEYIEITKKLAKFFNKQSGAFDDNDIVQKLLLKRKRIIHKAVNKLGITRYILEERFRKEGNLKYTFIYVPEGNTPEIDEDENTDEESIKIINQYTREIGRINDSIRVNQFVSGMVDRNEVLEQFKDGKIHVIASMKCLDEGVDIPRAEHAIFCSSTGNPRQFIQRRGRILRTHPQKDIAVIHDLIVIPDLLVSDANSDTFKVERSLVEKEIERVMYFASLAINPFETESVFSEICHHYDLNIYTIHNKLKNND